MIKPDLLVLDDFGLKKFTAEESEDFRELLEERSFGKSLLLTTQLPFDHWSEVIPDPVLSEAIIDRLEGPALTLRITGVNVNEKVDHPRNEKIDHPRDKKSGSFLGLTGWPSFLSQAVIRRTP